MKDPKQASGKREVRIEYLKGIDAVRRLRRQPLGFLPLGSLERHGDHLPMGLDILKAHAVCCACARRSGGLVFPPHFYSAVHLYSHLAKQDPIARQRQRLDWYVENWCNLYTDDTAEAHLAEVMRNLRRMGVRVLVLYTGHYPECQRRMARRLAARFNRGGAMKVIPFSERDFFGEGDHAGRWETSIFMALCPERVDSSRIKPRNYRDHGWNETSDPKLASAAFGRQAVRKIIAHLGERARILLKAAKKFDSAHQQLRARRSR